MECRFCGQEVPNSGGCNESQAQECPNRTISGSPHARDFGEEGAIIDSAMFNDDPE